jgi:hypothetical protein
MSDKENRIREIETGSVEQLNMSDIFKLGVSLQFMKSSEYGNILAIPSDEAETESATSQLRDILQYSDVLNASNSLVSKTERLTTDLLKGYEPGESLNDEDAKEVNHISERWADLLRKKIKNIKVIHTKETGFISISDKIDDPEEFFKQEVWQWLSEQSKKDMEEGLRDLAVGSSTSSVMVCLRATENVLRRWHNKECEEGEKIDSGSWGHVFKQLSQIYDEEERPEVLTDFSYLKDRRNEVSHPEKSPDMEEAQVNLIRVKATIERAYDELEK